MNKEVYQETLKNIQGKTIAVVYVYEGEKAPGFSHYEVWKSDVISDWIKAVDEINCLPLILDVNTFITKAFNRTLPKIDYVINLSNGTTDLSSLAVVPSVCSFFKIPCIPSCCIATVVGENKKMSNILAEKAGINVPKEIDRSTKNGICRPICYGSSIGVRRFPPNDNFDDYLYQEFIPGFDVTTPLLYNPLKEELEVLPSILYLDTQKNPQWFLGETEKALHIGYEKKVVQIDNCSKERYINLAKLLSIDTFCRIDARYKTDKIGDIGDIIINNENLFFAEINPMPTIKENINFHTSLNAINSDAPIFECMEIYKRVFQKHSMTGFILSSAIFSRIKSMH